VLFVQTMLRKPKPAKASRAVKQLASPRFDTVRKIRALPGCEGVEEFSSCSARTSMSLSS
jgi:hypothetical protein